MEGQIDAKMEISENSYIDALISNVMEETAEPSTVTAVVKRGRKPKYFSEEDRRLAKREQNRRYRDRKRDELTALRRLAALHKNDDSSFGASSAFRGDINIEVGEESKT